METYVDGKRENNLMFRLCLKGREKYEKSKKSNSSYGLCGGLVSGRSNSL